MYAGINGFDFEIVCTSRDEGALRIKKVHHFIMYYRVMIEDHLFDFL